MVDTDVRMVWCSNYWNCPIAGHAWYKNEYVYFQLTEQDPDSKTFEIYRFNDEELLHALAERKAWEDLMGYSHTYLNNKCIGDAIFMSTGINQNTWTKNRKFFKQYEPTPENNIEINIPIEFLQMG